MYHFETPYFGIAVPIATLKKHGMQKKGKEYFTSWKDEKKRKIVKVGGRSKESQEPLFKEKSGVL